VVHVRSMQENEFRYSDDELKKLEDPRVKAFFVVNPGNPSSVAISPGEIAKIVNLVKTKPPDLIILTDDAYGTFVREFRSLMAELPRNTIGVYSYSKYFGCTGWRLGVIAVHQDNIIDEMISKHPKAVTDQLAIARSHEAQVDRPHGRGQPRRLPQPHRRPVVAAAGPDGAVLAVPDAGRRPQLPNLDDGHLPSPFRRNGRRPRY